MDQDIADLNARMRAIEEVVARLQDQLDQHIEADDEAYQSIVAGGQQAT